MKIIKPSYEIMDDISPFGIHALEKIEKCARICYKSEDKILDQAESAKKLIKNLIKNGHEAMLEHSCLSVKFICDRGVSHELVRHRMASFAQESTRWCNYSQDKFGNEITVIEPVEFEGISIDGLIYDWNEWNSDESYDIPEEWTTTQCAAFSWYNACFEIEQEYLCMINNFRMTPQMARSVLPNSLKTEIVVTANYREWRHIFQLRTAKDAHPEMRRLMIPLLKDLKERIPVIFDDIEVEE